MCVRVRQPFAFRVGVCARAPFPAGARQAQSRGLQKGRGWRAGSRATVRGPLSREGGLCSRAREVGEGAAARPPRGCPFSFLLSSRSLLTLSLPTTMLFRFVERGVTRSPGYVQGRGVEGVRVSARGAAARRVNLAPTFFPRRAARSRSPLACRGTERGAGRLQPLPTRSIWARIMESHSCQPSRGVGCAERPFSTRSLPGPAALLTVSFRAAAERDARARGSRRWAGTLCMPTPTSSFARKGNNPALGGRTRRRKGPEHGRRGGAAAGTRPPLFGRNEEGVAKSRARAHAAGARAASAQAPTPRRRGWVCCDVP